MFKKLITLIFVGLFLSGCAMTGVKPPAAPVTVCDQFPGPSLIEKYIPDLRSANTLVKLSVYEVSKLDAVKKKDIVKVLDGIDELATVSTTYNQMFLYIMSKVEYIRNNMGAEIMIIGDDLVYFKDVNTPISTKDICYIKYTVNDVRLKVLPWIPAVK
jgi:hypothetical protein